MADDQRAASGSRRDRGARLRILRAAHELFRNEGIVTTSVTDLAAAASVSSRTLYKHFPSKSELTEAYLRGVESESLGQMDEILEDPALPPTARLGRLLESFFAAGEAARPLRGCALHNAVVETADAEPRVTAIAHSYKSAVCTRLAVAARAAGASDPVALARQLSLVVEGAGALSTSTGDPDVFGDARKIAALLVEHSIEK